MSFGPPKPTTNPYVKQLASALASHPDVELLFFTRNVAIFGRRYDVFHVHWPEMLLEGRTPARRAYRRITTLLLCARLVLARTRVVRTMHNLERPSGLARTDHLILDLIDRMTVLRIRLNDSGPMPEGSPYVTIPHGHYVDWFRDFAREQPTPGRMVFVGLVRRYKGVERLIETFLAVPDEHLSLQIAGLPSTPELAEVVTGLAGDDNRIGLQLKFLEESDYVEAVTTSQLVVLPYRHMHNSGSVLAALSLDRPVLVPSNEVNERLADEVGPGWIHLYGGDIGPDDLVRACAALEREPLQGSPDLSARGWEAAGVDHLSAYRSALTGAAPVELDRA